MRFINFSDSHLRKQIPRCRLDTDWIAFQEGQLQFIADEANKRGCCIIHNGDIFNNAVVSDEIVNMFLKFAPKVEQGVYFIAGNHDLLQHSLRNINESSIRLLISIAESMESPYLRPMQELPISWAHFGQEIQKPNTDILFLHRLVFKTPKDLPPNVDAITAQDLLDEYSQYKWIFTGDAHSPFIYKSKDGRYVVNPGHMNRQKIDELSAPLCYFVDTDKELIETILIPDDIELVTDSYTKKEEERETRIEAFVETVQSTEDISLSFIDNIEKALEENKSVLNEKTVSVIRELIEEKE